MQADTGGSFKAEPVRVLVIEDNAPDVMLIAEALRDQRLNFELTHVTDGEQALATLSASDPKPARFDLIMLDLNMPRLGGLEVLSVVRGNPAFTATPVLVLTSSLIPSEKEEALRLGADRYLRKPSDLDEFFNEVGGAIREVTIKIPPHARARGAA